MGVTSRFQLRLSRSCRIQATELALRQGISLNEFILQAIVESMARLGRLENPTGPSVDGAIQVKADRLNN